MFSRDQIDDTLLKRYLVELSAGDYLFRQNEKGNTLFVILEGRFQLSHRIHSTERLVGMLGAGEVVGEKAMLNEGPHRRGCSAIAMTEASVLEFGGDDLKALQKSWPDFTSKLLALVIRRLDKSNVLVSVLQVQDPTDRIVEYLLYLHHFFGTKEKNGVRVVATPADIAAGANVELDHVEKCLEHLLKKNILKRSPDGYLIHDEQAMVEYLPVLKERAAA
jgi:CRP/FNR family transcriptional regulator, cyclic AMP receptor protein